MLVSGCVGEMKTEVSVDPKTNFCQKIKPYKDRHSVDLVEDGGPLSVVSGATLIAVLDFGCDN